MPQTVSNLPWVCKDAGIQKGSKHTAMVNGTALVSSSPLTNRHTHVSARNSVTSNRGPRGPGSGRPPVGGAPPVTSDSQAVQVAERRDLRRRGHRNNNTKWRFKAPPLPVRDSEDWEKELSESMDSVSPQETIAPEDASLQAVTSAPTLPTGPSTTTSYSPASSHPPPFKWVRHVYQSVDGQFDDAED